MTPLHGGGTRTVYVQLVFHNETANQNHQIPSNVDGKAEQSDTDGDAHDDCYYASGMYDVSFSYMCFVPVCENELCQFGGESAAQILSHIMESKVIPQSNCVVNIRHQFGTCIVMARYHGTAKYIA